MKFTWFNLMPWPHLPDDFRQTHRSVWVDIPSTLYDPVKGHEVYNTYLDHLEYAEEMGFDGIGVNEHPANPRRRGVRHARRHVGRPSRRRLPRRYLDGFELRLWHRAGAAAREIRRGASAHPARLGGGAALRLQRPLYQAALRQLLAEA